MNRVLVGLALIMIMTFLFQYQAPIISTEEAVINAEKHFENPPVEWKKSLSFSDLNEITPEIISVNLNQKQGFWNELTNKQQWEVQLEHNGTSPTFVLDAYTGKIIDIYGPLN
ncbi:PepSY domain-containing protein [Sporosarcina sp. Marseille-Q4063]|uniref:PepSY domain-containing protein n=1 Tax=Sporosarcina sp. Marseille-Q4063 TaxID=2810514 RepID=UPI001BB0184F|nr:PepSY domain-containing protein [Sporosarcina sp. Marseille-Q4063]QUW22922.1 PepSY domain-containing protein [Sporosarcina sp. Marseille-Q4063]